MTQGTSGEGTSAGVSLVSVGWIYMGATLTCPCCHSAGAEAIEDGVQMITAGRSGRGLP